MITSLVSLTVTLFFAGFNAFCALVYGEASKEWYLAIAAYFLVFALLRFTIVAYKWTFWKRSEERKCNLHILNGVMFIGLAAAFTFSLIRMIGSGGVIKNGALLTITCIHTVFKVSMAIHRVNKAYKKDDLVKMTIRNIALAETLISFVTFLASWNVTFGNANLRSPLFIGVAALIVLYILYMGIKMIAQGRAAKRMIKK